MTETTLYVAFDQRHYAALCEEHRAQKSTGANQDGSILIRTPTSPISGMRFDRVIIPVAMRARLRCERVCQWLDNVRTRMRDPHSSVVYV